MIADSPHLYRQRGIALGHSEELIERAIDQARRVENRGLASVLTLGHLAHQTGVPYPYLREIIERRRDPYRTFQIARRDGSRGRVISTPEPTLMWAQRWLLKNVLGRVEAHPASFAYEAGKSIKTCATRHLGAKWLIKLDLHDFFETINEVDIFRVLVRIGYGRLPSLEIARLCTRYAGHASHLSLRRYVGPRRPYGTISPYSTPLVGFLPQGAPTSGALANHVASRLDVRLSMLAAARGLVYTRYADDLTFSSSGRFDREAAVQVIRAVEGIAVGSRFVVHKKKTRIVPPGARKIVLGLLVDGETPRLSKDTRRRIVGHVRGVEVFGLSEHRRHRQFESLVGLVNYVSGLLAFAQDIEPSWASEMRNRWTNALTANGWRTSPEI
jgi:RNA-directed DNA polymerase